MDMDDDFIGEIEFDLSPEQADLVSRAIGVASNLRSDDDFIQVNPLIAIMGWWKAHRRSCQSRSSPKRHWSKRVANFSLPTRRRNRGAK